MSLLPPGETGKTEAWVVVEAAPESRIYAGLKAGTTPHDLRRALTNGTVADDLVWFSPKPGDGVFVSAGTVHALGDNVVAFEIQQNSDVTFSLYDWDHVDAKTGQRRPLQIDQALACVDFAEDGAAGLVTPVVEATTPAERETLYIVNISGCGVCASILLPSVARVCRAFWYASRARRRSSTSGPIMPLEKATYWAYRRWSESALFIRTVQCPCDPVGNCGTGLRSQEFRGWNHREKANCV